MKKNIKRPSYWTDDKLAELRRDYPNTPIEELAKRYKVSVVAIYSQARLMGVRKTRPHSGQPKRKYSLEQMQMVLDNYEHMSGEELAQMSGVPQSIIRVWAHRDRRGNG